MSPDPVVHIIDDDDAVRRSLKFLIECAGHVVRDYPNAVDFLARLESEGDLAPGCIVTDVRMPQMTGIELIARLNALGVTEPVIVITGHADVPMAIQAMKNGVLDFIEKPFSDDAILSAIQSAIAARTEQLHKDGERQDIEARLNSLSQREREVLNGLVQGKANKVIAFDLGISVRTVEVHRAHVMTKMQVRSLSELVRLALRAERA